MFNRAWLAGGIPRTACVAAYEPICAVSLADSYINRANPGTNNAAPGVAPAWAAETGWTFNGSTQYLTTGVVPTNDQAYSAIVRFSGISGGSGAYLLGLFNASGRVFSLRPNQSSQVVFSNGASVLSGVDMANGVLAIAGASGYRDGAYEASVTAWTGANALGIHIGAGSDAAGSPAAWRSGSIQAVYIYNVPITPTQVRAVTDAMNMLPMRPRVPAFPSWMRGAALTQFRKLLGLRTGSRGVSE